MLEVKEKAFTLIELMVTVAIATVLMSIVAFDYSTFNDKLALSSAGQEMAIATRQAQSYGVNVRESGVGTGNFNYSYGIYFIPSLSPSDFYIFIDRDSNGMFNDNIACGVANSECVERISLRNGVRITALSNTSGCPAPYSSDHSLHITFRRPNPDAIITFASGGTNPLARCLLQSDARVTLTSAKLRTLVLTVDATGQIYVQ